MNQNEDLKPLMMHEVEIENAINLLIREGYFLFSGNDIVFHTQKIQRFYNEKMKLTRITPSQSSISSIKDSEKLITIQDFKEKAEIPFRITTNLGKPNQFSYNVGQISRDTEKYFNSKVIGKVNMEVLISATKAYYKDESVARPTLTNYFINGLWLDVYKNYQPKEHRKTNNSLRL